jgi:GT2 family glycosyltransferase
MTHEIRTPLNAIVGFSDLLKVIDSTEDRPEFIRIIRNNCDMLTRLINDIIEASNMNQGPLAIEADDVDWAVAFNDVDLCIRIGELGYRIVYDPYAELYHDESRSRGPEDTPEKVRRFQSEIEYFRTHHLDLLKNGDPNYNPNLPLKKWNYSRRV